MLIEAARRAEAAAKEMLALANAGAASCAELRDMLAIARRAVAALSAAQTSAAATIAGRERHGDRGAQVLADSVGLTRRDAHNQINTAETLQAAPAVRDAVESGRVPQANARRLAEAITKTDARAVESDASLLAKAESLRPDQFTREARRWTAKRQADGGEADYRRMRARRSVRFFDGEDGMVHLYGEFDPLTGKRIANRLHHHARKLHTSDQHSVAKSERRRFPQCLADALDDLTATGTSRPARCATTAATTSNNATHRAGKTGTSETGRCGASDGIDPADAASREDSDDNTDTGNPSCNRDPDDNTDTSDAATGCDRDPDESTDTGNPSCNRDPDDSTDTSDAATGCDRDSDESTDTGNPSSYGDSGDRTDTSDAATGCDRDSGDRIGPADAAARGSGRPFADICVVAHVDDDTARLIGELPDGTRLPSSVLDELTCNATITGVIFDRPGRPIWQTTAGRDATVAQRRILKAKWGGCFHCGANFAICQPHHIDPVSQGGQTHIGNLVPACWGCHQLIHRDGWQIHKSPDGRHTLHPPKRIHYGPAHAPQRPPPTVADPQPMFTPPRPPEPRHDPPTLFTELPPPPPAPGTERPTGRTSIR